MSRRLVQSISLALPALAMSLAGAVGLGAQQPPESTMLPRSASVQTSAVRAPVPFSVGERLQYDVRFGGIKVGTGAMEVLGIEEIRGKEAWHTRFTVKGGIPFYKVNDRMESWIDTQELHSLRFIQDLEEGRRDRERHYEIYPERSVYVERPDTEEIESVSDPLDDGAFLYFVRTIPLEVGETYTFNNYFRPDRNPVKISVLRRETIEVPAGTFETIVIQPSIKTNGLFSEKGHAEIWLTDDDRRMMVQMKSRLSIGSLNLYLTDSRAGEPAP